MGYGRIDGGADLPEIHHVHLQRETAAAERGDFVGQIAVALNIAQAERNVGSGVSQCECGGAAESAAGGGNESDLSGEVEAGIGRHGGSRISRVDMLRRSVNL
jgi:hypothetical protein